MILFFDICYFGTSWEDLFFDMKALVLSSASGCLIFATARVLRIFVYQLFSFKYDMFVLYSECCVF